MASAPLHFAVGAATGMAILAPRLRCAWKSRHPLAAVTRTWLLASWGCGIAASVPSLLRYVGVPESAAANPAMNLFFLHPWINGLLPRKELLGGAAMALCLACQYGWILAAVVRAGKIRS